MARLVAALVLVVAVHAHAEKRNPVEKLASDAAQAYHAGEYQRAVELLERAFKMQPVTALLYNLAKAYDRLGDSEKAADAFAKYAAAEDADPKLKAKAEARLAVLMVPQHKAPPKNEPPPRNEPPRNEPPAHVEAPAKVEPPPVDPVAERQHAVDRTRRRDRVIALSLGLVGVAALSTALGLSLNALSLHGDFSASASEVDKRQLRDAAQAQALGADLLYAVGAAAVGVTAYFLYRGFHRTGTGTGAETTSHVALGPWLAPGGGGLVAGGRF